jgi:hypothetical protein
VTRSKGVRKRRQEEAARGVRTCSRCGLTKPLEEFHRQATSPDGRNSVCRECRSKSSQL